MGLFPLNKRQKGRLGKIANIVPVIQALGQTTNLLTSILGTGPATLPGAMQYLLAKKMIPIGARIRLPDIMAETAAREFSGTVAKNVANALSDATAGGIGSVIQAIGGSNIVDSLRRTDDIIGKADKKLLEDAYKTMVSVAPTLARDKNAVRALLREVALAGTGPDYNTIRQLAEAERAIKRR